MEFEVGYRTDEKYIRQPNGSWGQARNILISKGYKSIANEEGFEIDLNTTKSIIGVIPLDSGKVIFSADPSTGGSEIGIDRGNGYEVVINDPLLRFSVTTPIEGLHKFNAFNELTIVWCSGVQTASQPISTLNIDNPAFPIDPNTKALVNATDINLIKLFPDVAHPSILLNEITPGGSLESGAYYFSVAYEITNNDTTDYLEPSNPVFVGRKTIDTYFGGEYMDIEPGVEVNKSINLTLSNLDTSFEYFKLAVIKNIKGVLTAEDVGRFKIDSTSLNLTYYGQKQGDLTLSEVTVPKLALDKVESITGVKNKLYVGRYTTNTEVNYQKYANNIVVGWEEEELFVSPDRDLGHDEVTGTTKRTWMPDEVYALYIHLVFTNGKVSNGFHLPGRLAGNFTVNSNFADIPEDDLISIVGGGYGSTQELEISPNVKYFHTRDTSRTLTTVGNMGFWENENETYPNTEDFEVWDSTGMIGNIQGQKVRHHKIPSERRLQFPASIFKLKLSNVYFPSEILNRIQGFFVSYAKRGEGNLTCHGTVYPTAQNYWFDLISRNEEETNYGNAYRIWDTALLHTKPENPIRYLKTTSNISNTFQTGQDVDSVSRFDYIPADYDYPKQNNVDREEHARIAKISGDTKTNFQLVTNKSRERCTAHDFVPDMYFPFYNQELVSTGQIFYTTSNVNKYTAQDIFGGDTFLGMDKYKNYHNSGRPYKQSATTASREDVVVWTVLTDDPLNNFIEISGFNGVHNASNNFVENRDGGLIPLHLGDRVMLTIDNSRSNGYHRYVLVMPTDHTLYSKESGAFAAWGAEFVHVGAASPSPIPGGWAVSRAADKTLKITINGELIWETSHPDFVQRQLQFRQAISSDPSSPYYYKWYVLFDQRVDRKFTSYNLPFRYKDNLVHWWDTRYEPINYDKSFHALNDIKPLFPHNPLIKQTDTFDHTVARSQVSSSDDQGLGWRKFLVNDSFTFARDKGKIIAVRNMDNVLFVQFESTLYIDHVKDKLGIESSEIYVGTGDIFDREPREPISTPRGYIGSQSKFSCFVCKLGYVVIDNIQGKVFLIKSGVDEISRKGVRNEFKSELKLDLISNNQFFGIDNPFAGIGFTAGYDEDYDRLIISKITGTGGNNGFTMSYSSGLNGGKGGWICKHDYTPNYLFSNREGLFSVYNPLPNQSAGHIYKHNIEGVKGTYYNGTVYKSYIDVIFNEYNEISKLFGSAHWESSVIDSSGVEIGNKTATHIMIYSFDQCTGEIVLSKQANLVSGNTRNREGTWNFNDLRDIVIDRTLPIIGSDYEPVVGNLNTALPYYNKNKFIGKFAIVRIIYDNSEQNTFLLHDIRVDARRTVVEKVKN